MKKLFTIALLISCIVCKGQEFTRAEIDSLLSNTIDATHKIIDSAWLAKEKRLGRQYTVAEVIDWWDTTKYYFSSSKPKIDTIKIIYQYSDTAIVTSWICNEDFIKKSPDSLNWKYLFRNQYIKDTLNFYDKSTRWAYGYLVIVSDIHSSIEHYLDAEKHKLWKNIVVWKYIEIE